MRSEPRSTRCRCSAIRTAPSARSSRRSPSTSTTSSSARGCADDEGPHPTHAAQRGRRRAGADRRGRDRARGARGSLGPVPRARGAALRAGRFGSVRQCLRRRRGRAHARRPRYPNQRWLDDSPPGYGRGRARIPARRVLGTAPSLLDLVGNTPLVELSRFAPGPVRLYAKLESENPTGSIKDRVAKAMIEAAEASGQLEPGRRLLEPTSGNTGISLALVAKLKGYPLTCVMPENATEERRKLLRLYGAEIVESPGAEGSNGAVRLALELAEREPSFFMPFQYANEANPRAHYEGTGAEIAEALDRVDVLVAGLGTGGTLMGTGARLRQSFPDVVVAAAEPLPGEAVMGLRSLEDGYVPPILDVSQLDRKLLVSNAESVTGLRHLLATEGIVGGVVVCILADGGWKYLSADFWDAEDVETSMERTVWW